MGTINDVLKECDRLTKQNTNLKELLKKHGFETIDIKNELFNRIRVCRECKRSEVDGHAPNCALSKALEE